MLCEGNNVCELHRFFCPDGYLCNISCGGNNDCQTAEIVQSTAAGSSLTLYCGGNQGCYGARYADCDSNNSSTSRIVLIPPA